MIFYRLDDAVIRIKPDGRVESTSPETVREALAAADAMPRPVLLELPVRTAIGAFWKHLPALPESASLITSIEATNAIADMLQGRPPTEE